MIPHLLDNVQVPDIMLVYFLLGPDKWFPSQFVGAVLFPIKVTVLTQKYSKSVQA